ncbi:MAG: hypothetical protein GEU80_04260 [Dehalococcoidia bacterium]|nr:hypothetical protein [Dehalococcoidia bacterium]
MAAERTEQPTRKRVDDARKRGQVARSREVDSAIVLLAGFGVCGAAMWEGMEALLVDSFSVLDDDPLTMDLTSAVGVELIGRALLLLAPLLAAVAGLSLLGGVGQTGGPLFSTEAIKPQLKRVNPLTGAKRLFASKQSYVQLAKSLLKILLLGGVAALALWRRWDELAALGVGYSLHGSLGLLVDIAFEVVLQVTLLMVALAVADYLFQRFDHTTQLRMTKQEVKEEMRNTDGDPQSAHRWRACAARCSRAPCRRCPKPTCC